MLYTKLKHKVKVIKELQELGVIPNTLLRNIEMFEYYHSLPEDLCVYCKYEVTAEKFGKGSDLVKAVILKLKN